MIFRVILCCLVYICAAFAGLQRGVIFLSNPKETRCVTGYMTDIQQWVDETGRLINQGNISSTSIVISSISRAVWMLEWELSRQMNRTRIQYLSMANCGLTHVPSVFQMSDNRGQALADTIEYVTFYGNYFGIADSDEDKYNVTLNATQGTEVSADITSLRKRSTLWSVGFQGFTFTNLKELDLRSCSIQAVGNHTFQTMVKLKRIYLGENNIHYIEANAFSSLTSLKHLDLSRNYAYDDSGQPRDMIFESLDVFRNTSLESLDFSFTKFGVRNIGILKSLERSLKSLSICHSEITNPKSDVFYFSLLKILDVSGNNDILCVPSMFPGLNNTLEIMYADKVGFRNMEYFQNYSKLEILKLTDNEISYIPPDTAITLRNLQILDLDNNRMVSWFNMTFSSMPKLKLLSFRNNNINTLENEMYEDLKNLSYISLSGNFLVCNCHVGDLYDVAFNNEYTRQDKLITPLNSIYGLSDIAKFHKGFQDFNNLILRRRNITNFCKSNDGCDTELNPDVVGNYLLLDYGLSNNVYNCMIVDEGRTIPVFTLSSCAGRHRESDIMENYVYSWKKTVLFIIPVVLLTIVFFVFAVRKKLRYFIITMRNLSMLSLINKKTFVEEGALFNYDVFVSYCNEDRAWVLHQLLPHVEKDCNISVCLHERDFQVGLPILENIVSCMDRSRSIMLIISKKFLLSQWCQFEMHLAQHRLLETRREDLILVLLEEIPRRLRPKTLHYLMLTKTYLVFPKGESERNLFWKRMKKSIITHKLKHQQNVSLA